MNLYTIVHQLYLNKKLETKNTKQINRKKLCENNK